jgi:hypothetical protein
MMHPTQPLLRRAPDTALGPQMSLARMRVMLCGVQLSTATCNRMRPVGLAARGSEGSLRSSLRWGEMKRHCTSFVSG